MMERPDSKALADAQAFSLDALTERLIAIAAWRDELQRKLARAADDVWGRLPDLDELRSEVERFKLACKGVRS
jgi:hypothetical protein